MDVLRLTYATAMPQTGAKEIPIQEDLANNKNFGLSPTQYQLLLDKLATGDETLFEQVFVTQFRRCTRRLMLKYSASEQDADDAVMDALLHFRKLLLAGKVAFGNLEAYFILMVQTNYLKKKTRSREYYVASMPFERAEQEEETYSEEEYHQFARAWSALCDKCQGLLEQFYYNELAYAQIATQNDKNVSAIKQEKYRCIEKLRKLFFAQSEK